MASEPLRRGPRIHTTHASHAALDDETGGTTMCGIVGYVGQRSAQDVLLAGLEKLEYRGYDSAGISVQADGELTSVRAVGNLSALRTAIERVGGESGAVAVLAPPATAGIGH